MLADLEGRQLRPCHGNALAKFRIDRERLRCLDAHGIECVHEGTIAGVAHGFGSACPRWEEIPIFRRVGRAGDKPSMFRLGHHISKEEFGSFAKHRIGARAQEFDIAIEGPMVPQLQRDPDASSYKYSPTRTAWSREAPWICNCMNDPSRSAIHVFGGFAAFR